MTHRITDPEQPVCQWCHQPITHTPTWWDGRPQCVDPHACARRESSPQQPTTRAVQPRRTGYALEQP